MGGSVLFQDALAARLGVMHPSREDLERFLEGHPPKVGQGQGVFVMGGWLGGRADGQAGRRAGGRRAGWRAGCAGGRFGA